MMNCEDLMEAWGTPLLEFSSSQASAWLLTFLAGCSLSRSRCQATYKELVGFLFSGGWQVLADPPSKPREGALMGSAAQYFEVEAPVAQVYAYWRDFSNFPAFMPDVQEVTVTGPTTSHWKVTGPLGKSVEWDAEIVEPSDAR
jgi:Polyketide cyclase / dehydrase and lipid transport